MDLIRRINRKGIVKMKFFIFSLFISPILNAQVVEYSDSFLRDTKMGVFKGTISLHPKEKSFLDLEENRILAAKRLVILQMLFYYKYEKKIHIEPKLEEFIVMESPSILLRNFQITEVSIARFPKQKWNTFEYVYRSFAYKCEFSESNWFDYLKLHYDSQQNLYKLFGQNSLSKDNLEKLDESFFKQKNTLSIFMNADMFNRYNLSGHLKNYRHYLSKKYINYFQTILNNQTRMEKLYAKHSEEDNKYYSLSDEDAEIEDSIRKRQEGSDYSIWDDSQQSTQTKKNTPDKKSKLSTMEKAIIIGALKSRNRVRVIRSK